MEMNMKTGVYIYNDELHNFNFRTNLSAYDKTIFVRTVVDTIVSDNSYDSVLRDIIFDYTIISMFTDIDTSLLKTIDDKGNTITDINLIEDFLLSTNIVEIVKTNAFPTLFDELDSAVDKSIQYLTGIYSNPIADSIASLLSAIEKKINEVDLDSMMNMAQKFAGMTEELTPESIMNAYINSDIHRNNLNEIAKTKDD